MAPGQDDASGNDDAERERFSRKLDGYEAMGLQVDGLRRLLEGDLGEFKATYMDVIRGQLEGGVEETPEDRPYGEPSEETAVGEAPAYEEPEEEPVPAYVMEKEPTPEVVEGPLDEGEPTGEAEGEEVGETAPSEELAEEEIEEDMELALEGAGPEQALAGADIPEEEGAPEEAAEEAEEPEVEEGPEEEGVAEEEEVEISIEGEEPLPEEAPMEEEAPPSEPEEEAEIEVGEVPEGPEEEAAEVPEEGPEEEALIVVAEVVEEEPVAPEDETEVRLAGLTREERAEEPVEEEVEPELERPPVRPVKKVVPKRPVAGTLPPEKAPSTKAAPREEAPRKAAPKKPTPKEGVPRETTPKTTASKKRTPPPPPKRRPLPTMFFVILVAALVVVSGMGGYFVLFSNDPPTAIIKFDPGEPLVGEMVTFDAGSSFDPDEDPIDKYLWDFGDGSSGSGRVVTHAYIGADSFKVRLSLEDDRGGRATVQRSVQVGALVVSMERPYEGDLFRYDVEGNASLENPTDGLATFQGATGKEYVWGVEATFEGEKTFEVTGTLTAKDGFMKDHDNARVERTYYDLDDITGQMETSLAINPNFVGAVEAFVDEDVCQQWDRVIRSTASVYTEFSSTVGGQNWATLTSSDEGTFYSQLTGIEQTFSLDGFLRETAFDSEDRDAHDLSIGESTYRWQVKGMERIPGREVPSLHVNVTMDRDTLAANRLDNFFIDVWLEKGLSQPAKHHVYVKGREQGNRFTVDLTETLRSASMGDVAAHDLPCGADHSYSVKEDYSDDFTQLDRVPEQGGTAGGFRLSPEDGYTEALKDPDFSAYITTHPTAFFHLGNYTEGGDVGRWEMSFGQYGSSEHYWVEAKGSSALDIEIDRDDYIDDTLPLSSRSDIGEVVTLSRGMRLLRAEPEIGGLCFNGPVVRWSQYTFNVTEGVSTISLDPTSALVGAQETGYVYMLVGRSGPVKHTAALDATNGQVLFTWKHSETRDLPEISI